jgi:Flp pilus assembly protein TadD
MQSVAQRMAENCQLGLADLANGRLAEADRRFNEMLEFCPDFAPALYALGVSARQQRRTADALSYATRALAITPQAPRAHLLMARALCDLDRHAQAAFHYRTAIAHEPTNTHTRLELAAVAAKLGEDAETEAQYRATLALCPDDAAAFLRLTEWLRRARRGAEAGALCLQRLTDTPNDPEAAFELGNILYEAERYDEAVAAFRAALQRQPDHAGALENLGSTLLELGQLADAEFYLRQARDAHPDRPGPPNGLGASLRQRGDIAGAEACFRTALSLAPDHAEAACNLATTLLLTERYSEGWPLLEARWGTAGMPHRGFAAPLWQGERLAGRRLLLHAEQGFGDTLQFCRFIPQIADSHLILEVPAPLARLMRQSFPELAQLVAHGDPLPPFDLHCPLMSLPLMLGQHGPNFGAKPAYLVADAEERAIWRQRLSALPGRRVGLVWQGNPRLASMRRRRDLPTEYLPHLASLPDISFVSLQKSVPVDGLGLAMVDWTDTLDDLAATAALVAELDLVIGVDTAVVHLAGALGRPVWLLNRFDTCWRWLLNRDDSPWYPSLKQIRQPTQGDWPSVINELRHRLSLERLSLSR